MIRLTPPAGDDDDVVDDDNCCDRWIGDFGEEHDACE